MAVVTCLEVAVAVHETRRPKREGAERDEEKHLPAQHDCCVSTKI